MPKVEVFKTGVRNHIVGLLPLPALPSPVLHHKGAGAAVHGPSTRRPWAHLAKAASRVLIPIGIKLPSSSVVLYFSAKCPQFFCPHYLVCLCQLCGCWTRFPDLGSPLPSVAALLSQIMSSPSAPQGPCWCFLACGSSTRAPGILAKAPAKGHV